MSGSPMRVVATVLGLAAIAGLGALSQVPWPPRGPQHALIRLAWRTRGHRVEECRRLTAEELARLPVHMRQEEVCEGRVFSYRLRVLLDGRVVAQEDVRPSGGRGDRLLYVFREISVAPGERMVEIAWVREDDGQSGPQEAPAVLRFEERLVLEAGQVALVTYDPERRTLVRRGYGVVP